MVGSPLRQRTRIASVVELESSGHPRLEQAGLFPSQHLCQMRGPQLRKAGLRFHLDFKFLPDGVTLLFNRHLHRLGGTLY